MHDLTMSIALCLHLLTGAAGLWGLCKTLKPKHWLDWLVLIITSFCFGILSVFMAFAVLIITTPYKRSL